MENETEHVKRRITYKDFFNIHSLAYLICGTILGSLFLLLIMAIRDWSMSGAIDGSFLGGCMAIGFGLLFWAGNDGTFDVISLGFSDLVSTIKRNGKRKYESLFDYREQHKAERKNKRFSWLAFILVGIIFLIISVILYFIYY